MRRSILGWLGAGLATSSALLAGGGLGACSSKGTGGSGTGTSTSTSTSGSGAGPSIGGDSVLMHHKNPTRDGVYVQPALTKQAAAGLKKDPGFNAVTKGATYAQPLFVDGGKTGKDMLLVATEANYVHALDAATGAELWNKQLGAPVPLSQMPCGNIDPYGVTGTPVIDFASRTVFLDAMVTPDGGGTKQHLIFALSLDDGAVKKGWPVDVAAKATGTGATFEAQVHGQRGALAVMGGTLYVPYGGLYGDCGQYHGWIVSVSLSDPTQVQAWRTTATAGGTWAMSGIASDGASLFIATGNTIGAQSWSGGEAILRFGTGASFGGKMADYFAPKNWMDLDNGDVDIGGTGPVIFDLPGSSPSRLALALGKDGNAYLLDRTKLGGVSDPVAFAGVASNEIINAAAVYSTALGTYVAFKGAGTMCTSGSGGDLATIKIKPGSPPTFEGSWCASQSGSGSPMVTTTDGHANAIVWSLGAEGDQLLHGFDGDTGQVVFDGAGATIPKLARYNTPIAAKGRIFVAAEGAVVAFKP